MLALQARHLPHRPPGNQPRTAKVRLTVVLDAYSRRVIGWELGHSLRVDLVVNALEMALHERTWRLGALIHHSDRGVQYASREYIGMLVEHEIRISMSRRGSPYENARAERFMRTLKEEEVQGRSYQNVERR